MLIIINVNLTGTPLTPAQASAARDAVLEHADPVYRRDAARGLKASREVRPVPGQPLADLLSPQEWKTAVPWVNITDPDARKLRDEVNTLRGHDIPVGCVHPKKWWLVWDWDDLDRIMGRGQKCHNHAVKSSRPKSQRCSSRW